MRPRIMYRYRKMLQQEMQMDRTVQRLRTKMQVQHRPQHLQKKKKSEKQQSFTVL